jgi:chromosome segregation ATPase
MLRSLFLGQLSATFSNDRRQAMQDDKIEKLWQDIKTQRDELRLQMHLAKSELKDEWEALEKKWPDAESKLEKFANDVEHSAEDLRESLGVVGSELKETYHRIKTRLKEEQD